MRITTSEEESTESTILKLKDFLARKKPISFKIADHVTSDIADNFNDYFNDRIT